MVFHGLLHSDAIFLRFTDHRMQSFPMGANHRFSDAMFAMYSVSPDLHLNIFHMNKVEDVLVFASHIVLVMTSSKSITANSDFFRSDVGLIAFFSHCQDCRLIAGNLFAASILIGSSRPSWDAHSLFLSFSSSSGMCFPKAKETLDPQTSLTEYHCIAIGAFSSDARGSAKKDERDNRGPHLWLTQ